MRIDEPTYQTISLDLLKKGTCFKLNGEIFIHIDTAEYGNAVNLKTGTLFSLQPETQVEHLPKARVVLE